MAERRELLTRDQCSCQRCGLKTPYGRDLLVHVVDASKERELENLILLCEKCRDLVMARGYHTKEEIVTIDPDLDGVEIAGTVLKVIASGVDNGWQAYVYGSKRRRG